MTLVRFGTGDPSPHHFKRTTGLGKHDWTDQKVVPPSRRPRRLWRSLRRQAGLDTDPRIRRA